MENIRFLSDEEMLLVAGGLIDVDEVIIPDPSNTAMNQYLMSNTSSVTTYGSNGIAIRTTFVDTNHDGIADTTAIMTSSYNTYWHNNSGQPVSL